MKNAHFPVKRATQVGRTFSKLSLWGIATFVAGFLFNALTLCSAAVRFYTSLLPHPLSNGMVQAALLYFGAVVVWGWIRVTYRIWTGRTLGVAW